jgi:fatty acid desaturase
MSDTLSKILNILLVVLLVVGAIFAAFFYFGGIVPETKDIVGGEEPKATEMFLNLGYIYAFLAVILTVGFAILAVILNPKAAVNTLIGVVIVGVIVLIGYGLASDAIFEIPGADEPITKAISKNVGAGLFSTYILLALAISSIVFTEVAARFK